MSNHATSEQWGGLSIESGRSSFIQELHFRFAAHCIFEGLVLSLMRESEWEGETQLLTSGSCKGHNHINFSHT